MSTYQELLARQQELAREQAELERQIQETLRAERAGVIQQIKAMMAEHGLTVADLSSGKPGRPARAASSGDYHAGPQGRAEIPRPGDRRDPGRAEA